MLEVTDAAIGGDMLDDWREWSAETPRWTARRATAALAAADLFLAFGLVGGAVAWLELPDGEPALRLGLGAFLALWVGGCAVVIARLGRIRRAAR
jgi:hypothetical protein